jgi:myo-inositol-1(or 4)-monophosphatase
VSIGIEHRGALAHAGDLRPGQERALHRLQGRGAFLNDRRVRVSKCARLQDALVGTGFPFKELSRLDLYTKQLARFMQTAAGVRRAGAPRSTSPTSRAAGSTRSGSSACRPGTWRPARC